MSPSCISRKSLHSFFRRQALKWSVFGFLLTSVVAIPCVLYSQKVSIERQLLSTAKSAVRVFRPLILQEDIRNVEFQMRKSLELAAEESALIYDSFLAPIYPLSDLDRNLGCKPNQFCWSKGFRTVSLLYPIYFDDEENTNLFGYLGLSLKPKIDHTLFIILSILLLGASIGQGLGLASALNRSAHQIVKLLSQWANHLKTHPEEKSETRTIVPFLELNPMQEAVDGLYLEIQKLREDTAKVAKNEAHVSILREIGHDLRTPHSLLARYIALHLDTVRTTGQLKEIEVFRVERTLKRMGELLRQVRTFSFDKSGMSDSLAGPQRIERCMLNTETEVILEDLRNDPDVLEKGLTLEFKEPTSSIEAIVSKTGYYRIFENLVRNAIEATPADGHINILLGLTENRPFLSIVDNGSGIPQEIRDRVFDLDFTTKPARGTGLGLGIVRKICTEFGATIHFESTPDSGTTFTVHFRNGASKVESQSCPEVSHV